MRKLQQTGDTIVEVLIVMAVISLVLVVSFVTSNRSLKSVQDAQEHTNAQQLVASQIEQLRTLAASATDDEHNVFTYASGFCVYNNNSSGSSVLTLASAATSPNCRVDSGGKPTTAQPEYNVKITRSCSTGCLFTVTADWPSILDSSTGNVTMYYRLYQESSS